MTRGLKMYSWSYQAMYGDNETPEPWSVNLVASMKWNAWKDVKGMDRVEAANKFILLAEEILEEYEVQYRPLPEHLQAYDSCLQNLKEV